MRIRHCVTLGLLTVLLLGLGYAALFGGLGHKEAFDAMLDHGIETTADVTKVKRDVGKNKSRFGVMLSWRGTDGALRQGEFEISSAFYERITSGDLQTVQIRYLAGFPHFRPIILADVDQARWYYREGIILGRLFLAVGAAGVVGGFLLLRA